MPDSRNKLLQFSSAGHLLGFEHDSVYVVGSNHMLKVEFAETTGARPQVGAAAKGETGVQPLNHVTYRDLWPGVDLSYEAADGGIIESTWRIAPGGAPTQIRLRYNAPVTIDSGGNLKINYETGWMRESAPIAWQQINGQRIPVQVAFNIIETTNDEAVVSFNLGQYNPDHPLLIDPVLEWNTFLGSTDWDEGYAMTVDSDDNVYITGLSVATWGSPILPFAGEGDALVAKLDASGTLLWNTFLGAASGLDKGTGIAVDDIGNAYIVGTSPSTWGSPLIGNGGGSGDAFVAKLNSSGILQWNTFTGSTSYDSR